MKYALCLAMIATFAQPPRRSVGAAADSRGNTVAWVSSGIARAKGPLPGAPVTDPSQLAGAWTVGGGSSSRSHGQADLNSDTSGTGLVLNTDGSYRIQYSATLIMGAFVSATKVTESGRWQLDSGRVTFLPSQHDGWISVMSGRKQPVTASNPPSRVYEAATAGGHLLLRGRCLPYQVDPYCGTKSEGYAILDFPLRRSTASSSPVR